MAKDRSSRTRCLFSNRRRTQLAMTQLNPQQQEAVAYNEGHLLIVAGPGTGKTHTITQKIAALIQKNLAKPEEILAITFTRKTGEELAQRLKKLLPPNSKLPFAGTFHSFCLQILRANLDENQRILSKKEQQEIFKAAGEDIELYKRRLAELKALDFDGILTKSLELLNGNAQLTHQLHQKIRYLFVDEYQDVNEVQYQLIQKLTGPMTKLCAIGDPDQAIYAFRGADVEHFLRFEKDFPGTKVFRLEENYRSTPNIVDCANALIEHNTRRVHKNLRSVAKQGPKISFLPCQSPLSEAIFIAKEINKLVGGTTMIDHDQKTGHEYDEHCHFTDIAVIYRTNHQGKLLATALKKEGLPSQRLAEKSWFMEDEITTVIQHLMCALDPGHLPQELQSQYQGFQQQYQTFRQNIGEQNPAQTIKTILSTFHLEQFEQSENILHLMNFATQFDEQTGPQNLKFFFDELKLLQEADAYDPRMEAVTLMSIHASKGLEFPVVFIAGVEEGILPYLSKTADVQQNLEEERRLMYVGLTRAKERVFLTYAKTKRDKIVEPSKFLKEISDHLMEIQPEKISNKKIWKKKQLTIW